MTTGKKHVKANKGIKVTKSKLSEMFNLGREHTGYYPNRERSGGKKKRKQDTRR